VRPKISKSARHLRRDTRVLVLTARLQMAEWATLDDTVPATERAIPRATALSDGSGWPQLSP
jgi:hypothetical protein